MSIFQFMIGNNDWAIPDRHNVRLIMPIQNQSDKLEIKKPIAVPYDFDYSGMVNAHYAAPAPILEIATVRTRLYMGFCLPSEEEYQEYFRKFIDVKEDMYALVRNFALLDSNHRNEMIDYLDSFYEIIGDPRLARRNIINYCTPVPVR